MTDYTTIFKEFADCDTFVISRSLLEEYKQKAADAEQERIIKLLEEARDKCACYREVGMPICRHQLSVDEQIALIKGENK